MEIYDRIPYSAIVNRKPLKLPDDGRVIVWPVVNLEEWVPTEPLPRRILTPPGMILPPCCLLLPGLGSLLGLNPALEGILAGPRLLLVCAHVRCFRCFGLP